MYLPKANAVESGPDVLELLRFVAHNPITWFVPYRIGLGVLVLLVLTVEAVT